MEITLEVHELQKQVQDVITNFEKHPDFNQLLGDLSRAMITSVEAVVVLVLNQCLYQQEFLKTLKLIGANKALRFNGYRPTSVMLLSGKSISIMSPYFAKARSKRKPGRKTKKRKAKSGCHLGLLYLGFCGRCSLRLTSAAVQAALLCPSFEIAKRMLKSHGIEMDVKTIRRLCLEIGNQAIQQRHQIALRDTDCAEGRTLFVCIDGGRLRERKKKPGRRKEGQKRQGYYTDWREPTQLVIQWLNADGTAHKDTVPLYDATLADIDGAFLLLENYLRQIDASKADLVVFCADGARKYWKRFSSLADKLDLNGHFEIIDYIHAKQNLQVILDYLPKKLGIRKLASIAKKWKNLLWQGNLGEIQNQIRRLIKAPTKLKKALTKLKDYFLDNYHRMKYAAFRHLELPTGSGCVESAIRRVINLRLKSPGIFWKQEVAEVMLFLRSTLLCGRWDIMSKNLLMHNRGEFEECN